MSEVNTLLASEVVITLYLHRSNSPVSRGMDASQADELIESEMVER